MESTFLIQVHHDWGCVISNNMGSPRFCLHCFSRVREALNDEVENLRSVLREKKDTCIPFDVVPESCTRHNSLPNTLSREHSGDVMNEATKGRERTAWLPRRKERRIIFVSSRQGKSGSDAKRKETPPLGWCHIPHPIATKGSALGHGQIR